MTERFKRIAAGWLFLCIAVAYFCFAYWQPPLGMCLVMIHLLLIVFDLAITGTRNLRFVGFNLGGIALAGAGAYLGQLTYWPPLPV